MKKKIKAIKKLKIIQTTKKIKIKIIILKLKKIKK